MLALRLIICSSSHLLSLRATHALGVLNLGVDLLSRGNDWKLHSEVVAQVWERYTLTVQSAHMRLDALVDEWPCVVLYAFTPLELMIPTLVRVWERGLTLILIVPCWQGKPWVVEIFQLGLCLSAGIS